MFQHHTPQHHIHFSHCVYPTMMQFADTSCLFYLILSCLPSYLIVECLCRTKFIVGDVPADCFMNLYICRWRKLAMAASKDPWWYLLHEPRKFWSWWFFPAVYSHKDHASKRWWMADIQVTYAKKKEWKNSVFSNCHFTLWICVVLQKYHIVWACQCTCLSHPVTEWLYNW